MTPEEKREALIEAVKEMDGTVEWSGNPHNLITLEGDFMLDELKEIVAIMEAE